MDTRKKAEKRKSDAGSAADRKYLIRRAQSHPGTWRPAAFDRLSELWAENEYDRNYLDEVLMEATLLAIDARGFYELDTVTRAAAIIQRKHEASEAIEQLKPLPTDDYLYVIDSFTSPKIQYDKASKIFRVQQRPLSFYGNAAARLEMYQERYNLLYRRASCCPTPTVASSSWEDNSIYSVSVLYTLDPEDIVKTMGIMYKEDGHCYLKDPSSHVVKMDLTDAIIKEAGYVLESTIVLVEGNWSGESFKVKKVMMPPLEKREDSLKLLAGLDYLGCGLPTLDINIIAQLESIAIQTFVILADVWLDDEKVMVKLESLLQKYEEAKEVPAVFVLMGNFFSYPFELHTNTFSSMRSNFMKLGQSIKRFKRLNETSRFIFIPGPEDAGPSAAIPMFALPSFAREELLKHIPKASFLSNPCRIKFYTKEMVFFRQDLHNRMRRSCVIPPCNTDDPYFHLVSTILSQSHLCPLPLSVQPVVWSYDHCLRLYPTPDTIVLGDKSKKNSLIVENVLCFNTGSFSYDSTYAEYNPSSKKVELLDLPNKGVEIKK